MFTRRSFTYFSYTLRNSLSPVQSCWKYMSGCHIIFATLFMVRPIFLRPFVHDTTIIAAKFANRRDVYFRSSTIGEKNLNLTNSWQRSPKESGKWNCILYEGKWEETAGRVGVALNKRGKNGEKRIFDMILKREIQQKKVSQPLSITWEPLCSSIPRQSMAGASRNLLLG